jgi:hypothetical protein
MDPACVTNCRCIHPKIWAHRVAIGFRTPKATVKWPDTAPFLRHGWLDKCDGYGDEFEQNVSEEKQAMAGRTEETLCTHPAPNAQWSRSIALGRLLDSAQVSVSPRKRSGLKANLSWEAARGHLSALKSIENQAEISRCVRIWIPLLIMVYSITIKNDRCVLRDVHPVVYKVFCRIVWRWYPKWRADPLYLRKQIAIEMEAINGRRYVVYLLDDGSDVRKVLLVLCTWPTISANHAVKFRMGSGLNFWV